MCVILQAVQPTTGDIIYDCFHDNQHLSELDSRLHHIQPVEFLVPVNISTRTDKLLGDFATSRYVIENVKDSIPLCL